MIANAIFTMHTRVEKDAEELQERRGLTRLGRALLESLDGLRCSVGKIKILFGGSYHHKLLLSK